MSSLSRKEVREVLERLHRDARGDWIRFATILPRVAAGWLRRKSFAETIAPEAMKDFYLPVSRREGEFLYLTARALDARRIVEFGTSFGISTIYLAAAVRDGGSGLVVGTELVPEKHARARANVAEAGLADLVDIRLGDAMETLKTTPETIDLVFMDGWKDLYLPLLKLLQPRLRRGAVVLGDNIYTFRKSLRPYVEYVQSGRNGFESVTLPLKDGLEYSVYAGEGK
jgi:predicted O-methyltransferase YrrM